MRLNEHEEPYRQSGTQKAEARSTQEGCAQGQTRLRSGSRLDEEESRQRCRASGNARITGVERPGP